MAKLRSRLSESEERNAVCVILKVDVHFGDCFPSRNNSDAEGAGCGAGCHDQPAEAAH
jgi:hypothetical protein